MDSEVHQDHRQAPMRAVCCTHHRKKIGPGHVHPHAMIREKDHYQTLNVNGWITLKRDQDKNFDPFGRIWIQHAGTYYGVQWTLIYQENVTRHLKQDITSTQLLNMTANVGAHPGKEDPRLWLQVNAVQMYKMVHESWKKRCETFEDTGAEFAKHKSGYIWKLGPLQSREHIFSVSWSAPKILLCIL